MTNKNKTIDIKYLLFISLIYIFVFQNYLQTIFQPIQYFDELFSLSFFFVAFTKLIKNKGKIKTNENSKVFLFYVIVMIIGLISSLINNYQSFITSFSDFIVCSKFFLVVLLSHEFLYIGFLKKYSKKIIFHTNIITTIFLILTIANYIFKLFPSDYRFGIMANRIIFGHQTSLVAVTVFLLSLRIILQNKTFDVFNIILLCITITTFRFKGIGAVLVAILIAVYVDRTNKRVKFSKFAFLAVLMIMIAYDQIEYYFFNEGFARTELTVKSLEIAKDYFPFGTGFATFASYFSAVNYSPVYYLYGLNNIHGLYYGQATFVSDVFWPMILGQFGFLGLIIYALAIYLIFRNIQKNFSYENKYIYISKLVCFIYLIISSTSESAFVHPMAIPLALIIGINMKKKSKKNRG